MYNFLNPCLLPKVECDSLSMDHYEVNNLISENISVKSRGFIAYSTVKPPINVDFQMLCSVDVRYVKVTSCVGQQRCTGIQLLMKNSSYRDYTLVSRAEYDKRGVVFCNRRFYSKERPPCNVDDYHLEFFMAHVFRLFSSADSVRLTINRTHKSVPCLADVEVWGNASRFCSVDTKATVAKLYNAVSSTQISEEDKSDSSSLGHDKGDCDDELAIPNDYKDALTLELMTMPMTLPSGKNVDQTTLEKITVNDANHGREPRDPFTGVKYTSTVKPILNVHLKTRIDLFLLKHGDRFQTQGTTRILGGSNTSTSTASFYEDRIKPLANTKRTAGTGRTVCRPELFGLQGLMKRPAPISFNSSVNPIANKRIATSTGTNIPTSTETLIGSIPTSDNYKRTVPSSSYNFPSSTSAKNETPAVLTTGEGAQVNGPNRDSKRTQDNLSGSYVNENDDDDLNRAIKKVISNVVSYKKENKITCAKCNEGLKPWYKVPCNHYYCRPCMLVVSNDLKCDICKRSFTRNEIEKINV